MACRHWIGWTRSSPGQLRGVPTISGKAHRSLGSGYDLQMWKGSCWVAGIGSKMFHSSHLIHQSLFLNSVSQWGLQPRIAPVCTSAGAGSGSTRFRRRFRRRSGRLWCKARSGSTGFRRRSGRLWCRAKASSAGFRRRFRRRFQEALVQSQVRFNRVPEKVPALGFAARFRQICKNKTLRLLGIPLKLMLF